MRALGTPPRLQVTLGDRTLTGTAGAVVACVQVQTRLGLPAQCLLSLDLDLSPDLDLAGAGPAGALHPLPGDALRIEVDDQPGTLFVGQVTGVEHTFGPDGSRLQCVHAYDALHLLRQRQQVRVLDGLSVRGLAEALAEGAGLLVEGPEGPALPRVYQHRQSDLQLLREQAERCGLYAVVDDGAVLRLVDLRGSGDPVPLAWGATLHSAEIEVSTGRGLRSVRAARWDPGAATSGSVTAADLGARADLPGAAEAAEPGAGREQLLVDLVAADDTLPAAWAQAELDVATMATVCAQLTAEGDTRLRAGTRVRLQDLSEALDGCYLLTEARHELDERGWVVTATTRPPLARPAAPSSPAATLATVVDVDDGAGRGRVRVGCPAYGGLTTDWLPVLTPGAGEGRGLVVPPDVGDSVVLLLTGDDLDDALVLGGLYGTAAPRDDGVAGGRVRRFSLGTGGGQQLVLDDGQGRLRLEHPNGSVVELGRDLLSVTAATDLVVEAPGHTLTLRAGAVRLEQAS